MVRFTQSAVRQLNQSNRYPGRDTNAATVVLMAPLTLQAFTSVLALGLLAATVTAASAESVPVPKPRPGETASKTSGTSSGNPAPQPSSQAPRFTAPKTLSVPPADLAALKEAITAARRGNTPHAAELQSAIGDPVARKLLAGDLEDGAVIDVHAGSDGLEIGRAKVH